MALILCYSRVWHGQVVAMVWSGRLSAHYCASGRKYTHGPPWQTLKICYILILCVCRDYEVSQSVVGATTIISDQISKVWVLVRKRYFASGNLIICSY